MTMINDLHVGDVVLTGKKSQGIVSLAIKLGQRLRGYTPAQRAYSHCAIIVSPTGVLAEAAKAGVRHSHISHFGEGDFTVISTGVGIIDQGQILTFTEAVIAARYQYGFVTFAGLALYCLTGGKLCVQKAGTAICSGFVADALTRAGVVWERPPYANMPADIAKHYGL